MKRRIGCWAGALAVAVTLASAAARTQTRTPAFDVVEKSIIDLQNAMTAGTVTSRQLVEQFLARIEAYDQRGPGINAFLAQFLHGARRSRDWAPSARSRTAGQHDVRAMHQRTGIAPRARRHALECVEPGEAERHRVGAGRRSTMR
jgi:hypothetical protein